MQNADSALRLYFWSQTFFRRLPALTGAPRDVSVTVGMNSCSQAQAKWDDRERTHIANRALTLHFNKLTAPRSCKMRKIKRLKY
jgi:hypothetical protein